MLKPDLERHANAMRLGITEAVEGIRGDGVCLLCGAERGFKHKDKCPSWPAIRAKAEYAMAADPVEVGED